MPNINQEPKKIAAVGICPSCNKTDSIEWSAVGTETFEDGYLYQHGYCTRCKCNFTNFFAVIFDELAVDKVHHRGTSYEEFVQEFYKSGEVIPPLQEEEEFD